MTSNSRILSTLAFLALSPAVAQGGGFATTRFGGEEGHAATDHLSAIYFNPAGLAYGHGTRGHIEGLFAYRGVEYTRPVDAIDRPNEDPGTPTEALTANSGKATLTNGVIQPFVGIATDAGVKGLGLGIGFYVPFGGQAKWDKNSAYEGNMRYPGAVDGTQRWAVIEGQQRSLYYTAAGAWRTPDERFAVGAGVNIVQNQVNLLRARNADGSDNLVAGANIIEGTSLLKVSGINASVSLGVMVKPTPCSRVGISYQSKPNFGLMKIGGTLTNKFGTAADSTADVELHQTLPDVIRAGGEWRAFSKASLRAEFDYQRWSAFKRQCIILKGSGAECDVDPDGFSPQSGLLLNLPRHYKDSVSITGGGRYYVDESLEVSGSLTFDSNAVPDATMDPSLFDMNKYVLQGGAQYNRGKMNYSLHLAYVYYNNRSTDPRTTPLRQPSRNPDMAGDYEATVAFALLGVGFAL